MNAEEFLSQYLDAKSRLHRLNEERESIRDLITHITPRYDSVSVRHDRNVNKIPDALGKLEELDKKYSEESRRAVEVMEQVHDVVYAITNHEARQVIDLYFISGKTHKEIAYDLHVSTATELRRFKQGIELAQSVIDKLLTDVTL